VSFLAIFLLLLQQIWPKLRVLIFVWGIAILDNLQRCLYKCICITYIYKIFVNICKYDYTYIFRIFFQTEHETKAHDATLSPMRLCFLPSKRDGKKIEETTHVAKNHRTENLPNPNLVQTNIIQEHHHFFPAKIQKE